MALLDKRYYCIRASGKMHCYSWRTGIFHDDVYHGFECDEYIHKMIAPSDNTPFVYWRDYDRTLTSTSELHGYTQRGGCKIVRSGRIVPDVFMPGPSKQNLVVNETLFRQASVASGVTGHLVEFVRLANVPLPALGDFTWELKAKKAKTYPTLRAILRRPVMPSSTVTAKYYFLAGVYLREVRHLFSDWREEKVEYGTYSQVNNELVLCSPEALSLYPLVNGVMREDLFMTLAPFLNLDFCNVGVIYT